MLVKYEILHSSPVSQVSYMSPLSLFGVANVAVHLLPKL